MTNSSIDALPVFGGPKDGTFTRDWGEHYYARGFTYGGQGAAEDPAKVTAILAQYDKVAFLSQAPSLPQKTYFCYVIHGENPDKYATRAMRAIEDNNVKR